MKATHPKLRILKRTDDSLATLRGVHMKRLIYILAPVVAGSIILYFFLKEVFAGNIILQPVLLRLGILEIRWYGVLIATGVVLAYLVGRKLAIREGLSEDHLIEGVFLGVILGIIGARLWFVAFSWELFRDDPGSVLRFWEGFSGLAIHGAIFGALVAIYLYTKFRKKAKASFLQGTDLFVAVLPLAQAIGRWGNFINYEAYGEPTSLPWRMFVPRAYRMPGYEGFEYFHPTFLYESLWNIGVFLVLIFVMKRRRRHGVVTGLYMILYSIARYFIEPLRLDSLYIGEIRTAQLTSIALIFLGFAIMIYSRYKGTEVRKAS